MSDDAVRLPPVSMTAVGVAAVRAAETQRSDRLFCDEYAGRFVQVARAEVRADPDAVPRRRTGSLLVWITVRTRFLDEIVLDACAGGCRQVVVLGAGLDARAFRLAWPPGVRLWEVDLPEVLEFKDAVARAEGWRPGCERTVVPTDLAGDFGGRLVAAGFEPARPVVWLAEGLLAYLSPEVSDALVEKTAELSAPGSRFGLTLASSERLAAWRAAHPDGAFDPADHVGLFRSTAPDDAVAWLAGQGWRADVFDVEERSAAYGRPIQVPAPGRHGARLVDARR